jgi:tRNA(Ile)-lysidine synthase
MPSAAPDPALTPAPALVARFVRDWAALAGPEEGRIGVALSGGPDSVALLLLAAAALPGRVAAMTVDHGLRAASAAEAEGAGALCRRLGVPHAIARVTVAPTGHGPQADARTARYAALARWATAERLGGLLTAHHADDQAETLLMRLARGAGLAGLAGIRVTGAVEGVALLRPLLGWRKAELEAIVAAAGVEPARDPSNHSNRYDRTAARRLLADTAWLDPLRLARAAAHLADAEAALGGLVADLVPAHVTWTEEGAILRPHRLHDVTRRLLLHLFADRFAKQPDGPAVERALTALARGESVTLADILCRPRGADWHFRPAPPRRTPPQSL